MELLWEMMLRTIGEMILRTIEEVDDAPHHL
jgi:hypothetical protein